MTKPFDFSETLELVVSALDGMRVEGYFQEAFGYECVDRDFVPGTRGNSPEGYLFRRTRRRHLWPYWQPHPDDSAIFGPQPLRWERWDEDTLFDVLEVLHDNVSKPGKGHYHSWSDCGWHYETFSELEGRWHFRETINDTLTACGSPWEMDTSGLVIRRAPEQFAPMLDASLPPTVKRSTAQVVEAAVQRFRARGSSDDDRRLAVLDLASVLEEERATLKHELFKADESALFEIANNFTIRHRNRNQKDNYDKLVWHTWIFYVYLATIHAVLRIKADQHP